ncbi:MAG TPA: ABC transporter substrate-binding protein, partial [Atribacterota bacterium]|nr:ABC transporter substrate-binding protein [Atribacterota bacterium]
ESQSSEVDLYQIDVIWPGDIAEHLIDLNEYGAKEYTDAHFPSIIQNNTVDNRFVAMPWFTDAGLLYYRTDLLEKYGYNEPPTTWDELEMMAEKVMQGERAAGNQDFWGFVFQGNSYEGLTCDALEWVYSYDGGSIVEPDGTISINNPNAIEALEKAAGWVGTIAPDGVTGFAEEDARNMFQAGNALFMRNWPYAYSLGNSEGSAVKDKFGVSPLPSGKNNIRAASLGGWQLACSKYSKNPELAADVLFFFTSYEQQKKRAIEASYNPTIIDLYEDSEVLEATPFFGTLKDVFTSSVARPSTVTAPQYAQVSKVFYENVHDVLTNESTAERAVKNIELDISDIIE